MLAKQIMELSRPSDGGLTDDQGLEIIEVFIDQNYEALDTFFREKVVELKNGFRLGVWRSDSSAVEALEAFSAGRGDTLD